MQIRRRRRFIRDPSLVLFLPLYELDGSSFMSRDAYGRLCTVTGATWGIQGRTFNGTSDKILTPASTFNVSSEVTLIAWVKLLADISTIRDCFGKDTSTDWIINFPNSNVPRGSFCNTTPARYYPVAPSALTKNTWAQVAATFKQGVNCIAYVNAVTGTPITVADLPLRVYAEYGVGIGHFTDNLYLNAVIGDCWIYNRALTPLEIQRNYLGTKWRYR